MSEQGVFAEVRHRETAQNFLIKHGGDNPDSGVGIDALAQLLAETEDATGHQFTKFWLEKQDKWREQMDALYAYASMRNSAFGYDTEQQITNLIKAFKTMDTAIRECEQRAQERAKERREFENAHANLQRT